MMKRLGINLLWKVCPPLEFLPLYGVRYCIDYFFAIRLKDYLSQKTGLDWTCEKVKV